MAMAAAASITGTARGTIQGSCRPWICKVVSSMVSKFTLRCGWKMDGVGFTAARNRSGIPFVIPPKIPPQ